MEYSFCKKMGFLGIIWLFRSRNLIKVTWSAFILSVQRNLTFGNSHLALVTVGNSHLSWNWKSVRRTFLLSCLMVFISHLGVCVVDKFKGFIMTTHSWYACLWIIFSLWIVGCAYWPTSKVEVMGGHFWVCVKKAGDINLGCVHSFSL